MSKKTDKASARAAIRAERREAAIARDQQRQRMRLLLYAGIAAVVVAAILIVVNLQNDDSTNTIDFSGIPSDGRTLGSPDAPVTLVEYADYQCPWCGVMAREDFPKIVDTYVRTGKVKIEFRAHPFLGTTDLRSPDNESVQPAVAAACALDQGKFWEFNEALFQNQNGENEGGFAREKLDAIAKDVGLDTTTFSTCMDEQTHLEDVIATLEANQAAGVTSTPTIEINGVRVAYTREGFDRLKTQIDAALNGEVIPQ